MKWKAYVIAAVLLLGAVVAFSGCIFDDDDDDTVQIVVTIPPQVEFVEAVGGDLVSVVLLVPHNSDPHTYSPTLQQMVEVAQSDAWFTVGSSVEFELVWGDTILSQNADLKVIDGGEGIELREADAAESVTPDQGTRATESDEHLMDPHTWLSPKNAIVMVENLRDGLMELDPDNADIYAANAERYMDKLRSLDGNISELLSHRSRSELLVYHPSWGYYCDDYNITQIPVEEAGKEPTQAGLLALIDQAKSLNITTVYVSPQFDQSNAEVIADEIGGEVLAVDPLHPDYLENLWSVTEQFSRGLA